MGSRASIGTPWGGHTHDPVGDADCYGRDMGGSISLGEVRCIGATDLFENVDLIYDHFSNDVMAK